MSLPHIKVSELPSDEWSDESGDEQPSGSGGVSNEPAPNRVRQLEKQLKKLKQNFADYKSFVAERLNYTAIAEASREATEQPPPPRDDDSHYFDSYKENGISANCLV